MNIRDAVSMATGMVMVKRIERSGPLGRVFAMRAAEAAERVLLGKSPTEAELEQIAEGITSRALVMIYSASRQPSKGALRDAAAIAGEECALEVMRVR